MKDRVLGSCLAVASVLLFAACSKSQPEHLTQGNEPSRIREAGFSLVPPDGWTAKEIPGLKYKPVLGTPEDGFAPNMNVVDEAYTGSLDSYVKGNLETLGKMMPKFEKVAETDFRTDDGVDGKKIVTTSEQNGTPMRQIFYMVPAKGKYFVLTCSDVKQHEGKNDATCDTVAKTFRME